MKKILIPVDFSEPSSRAVAYGKKMALAFDGKVTLLHVVHDRMMYNDSGGLTAASRSPTVTYLGEMLEKDRSDAMQMMEKYKEAFQGTGVEVECIVVEGNPADKIIDYVDENLMDMVIIGSEGIGSALRRVFLGSVANRVLHHVKVPVLLVQ